MEKLAREVVRRVNDRLKDGIDDMFRSWEQEPAYKIWEIVNKRQVRPDRIVGIGAAAGTLYTCFGGTVWMPGFGSSLFTGGKCSWCRCGTADPFAAFARRYPAAILLFELGGYHRQI